MSDKTEYQESVNSATLCYHDGKMLLFVYFIADTAPGLTFTRQSEHRIEITNY